MRLQREHLKVLYENANEYFKGLSPSEYAPNSKSVLVCGNGPSMRALDYTRIPSDVDIYRVNQFYCEEKYFVGKKVKRHFIAYVFDMGIKLFTAFNLKRTGEYEIEKIILGAMHPPVEHLHYEAPHLAMELWRDLEGVELYFDYIKRFPMIQEWAYIKGFFNHTWPTSGLHAIVSALAQGYENIYLAGIDFYYRDEQPSTQRLEDPSEHPDYFYKVGRNALTLFDGFNYKSDIFKFNHGGHSIFTELEFLSLINKQASFMGTKIYNVSDNSMDEILPKAPILESGYFKPTLEDKPKGYIADFEIPRIGSYSSHILNGEAEEVRTHTRFESLGIAQDVELLKSSIYYRSYIFIRYSLGGFIKRQFYILKSALKVMSRILKEKRTIN